MKLTTWTTRITVATALVLAAAWAFWPLGSTTVAVPEMEATVPVRVATVPLDESAFRLPLWVTPPPAPPAPEVPAKEPAPPPVKLQLLAIVPENERWKALFYDPEKDKIISAREGDPLAGGTLERIVPAGRDAGVVLTDSRSRSQTLALREPPPVLPEPKRGAVR